MGAHTGKHVWERGDRCARCNVPQSSPDKEQPCNPLVCFKCGSIDVQMQCWVDANTNEVIDDAGGYSWCVTCEDETTVYFEDERMNEEDEEDEREEHEEDEGNNAPAGAEENAMTEMKKTEASVSKLNDQQWRMHDVLDEYVRNVDVTHVQADRARETLSTSLQEVIKDFTAAKAAANAARQIAADLNAGDEGVEKEKRALCAKLEARTLAFALARQKMEALSEQYNAIVAELDVNIGEGS